MARILILSVKSGEPHCLIGQELLTAFHNKSSPVVCLSLLPWKLMTSNLFTPLYISN